MAGNRTQANCLEGSYAHHYTTIAWWEIRLLQQNFNNTQIVFNRLTAYFWMLNAYIAMPITFSHEAQSEVGEWG